MLSLTPVMVQSFAALLLAHVLADFVFQTAGMVKAKRHPGVFLWHITIVFSLSAAALGGAWPAVVAATVAHLGIDAAKTYALPAPMRGTATAFSADQAAHLASIGAVVLYWPDAAQTGLWAAWWPGLIQPALILSGFVVAVLAGGHVVALFMAPYAQRFQDFRAQGLPNAGKVIGQLERGLIFLLVLIGQPTGIGFLIAAKSLLRFEATKEQKASEYVIIGTLTSFGWALAVSSATMALISVASTDFAR